jgi:hypothetical protein
MYPHRKIINDLYDWMWSEHSRIVDYSSKTDELEDKYFNY